jgi:hypothetical protein
MCCKAPPAGKNSARIDRWQQVKYVSLPTGNETGCAAPLLMLPLKGVMAQNSGTEAKESRGRKTLTMLDLEVPVKWN